MSRSETIEEMIGQLVVLDLSSPYVCLGTLAGEDTQYVILEEADIHDLRDSSTTRDLYISAAVRHGININRNRAFVAKSQIVSLSTLEDVVP